jgi:hypothetical protein
VIYIQIREWGTDRVERELGPYANQRIADRAENGLMRQLDHERFYTETVERTNEQLPAVDLSRGDQIVSWP